MGAGQAAMGVAKMYQAKKGADAERIHSQYEANQAEFNAMLNEMRVEDLNVQADKDAIQRQKDISQMIGSQKVNLAAQGIDIDSDVAMKIKEDTEEIGRQDVLAIRNNAWKAAMGIEFESADMRQGASMTKKAGRNRSRDMMISGVFDSISSFRKK